MTRLLRDVDGGDGLRGLSYRCPGCDSIHVVYTEDPSGGPTWLFDGNRDKPTLSPSVSITWNGCIRETCQDESAEGWCGVKEHQTEQKCHHFIRAGQIEYLDDCTHEYAGETVPLPMRDS